GARRAARQARRPARREGRESIGEPLGGTGSVEKLSVETGRPGNKDDFAPGRAPRREKNTISCVERGQVHRPREATMSGADVRGRAGRGAPCHAKNVLRVAGLV